nr:autotransporter-associated beta strand repeat-containing protein [Candidatus Anammoximicrobium sp.]
MSARRVRSRSGSPAGGHSEIGANRRQNRPQRRRLVLEMLEDRRLLATNLWANVPEAANYSLVYEKAIPVNSPGWNSGAVPYDVNNAADITQPFDRIAYYWELTKAGGGSDWVYVSVDAFTADKAKIGIPNTASGAFFQQYLSNMNVASNVAGIVTGTGIATGNIEFWPSNYGQANDKGVPNASASVFDFGDGGAGLTAGHGSMQIHNYDVDGSGPGTAGQTLFGYSAWGAARTSELGLGNQPSGNPDWTFNTANISTYTSRTLQVLVRQVNTAVPPKLVQNVPELADYELVYQKTLPNSATYNTTGVAYDVDNSANIPTGSFDRVAYYVQLDGNFAAVSFDAAGFTNNAAKTGIPTVASGELYQQNVTNMNVTSNVAGIVNGAGLATGNIEFWPSNYSAPKAAASPANASDAVYDFGDSGASTGGGYGSMQVHNYDLDGAGPDTAGQTVFAYNRWGSSGGTSDLGLGNRGTGAPDWTSAQNANSYASKVLYVLVRRTTPPPAPTAPAAPAALVANAPELADYQLVYQKNLPNSATYNASGVTYDVNNAALVPSGSFDRVAYYVQLDGNFVEVSFDAGGFTTDATKIGIPNTASGEIYQQKVNSLNVTSNVAGVVNGTGLGTGNVEFWPNDYSGGTGLGGIGGNGGTYDYNDTRSAGGGYGSMQVHNHGAAQTVFAYNRWGSAGGTSDLGIGNDPAPVSGGVDWTFAQNANSYTTKVLYVLVRPVQVQTLPPAPVAPPAPAGLVSNAPELADYQLVYRKELPLTANYSSGPVAYDENYVSRVPYGSFDRVAYYLQLDGNFVEVSFNADGFTSAAGLLGIPNTFSGESYQQYVQNVNVASNVAGVVTGTGIGTGNVEFWPNDYSAANGANVPGGNGGTYDFGDTRSSGGAHGSMQVHNYGAAQTLFAYNNWNTTGNSSLGIGNQPSGQPDWTFNYNTPSFTTRSLYVLVRPRHVGTSGDDQILLQKVNGIAQYTVNGGWPVTLSGDTTLQIDGLAGNDTVTIDFSGGDPIPAGGVIFDGGDGSDAMNVLGGTFAAVTHHFTGPGAGNLDLDGDGVADITYGGLEPFLMTSGIGDLVLDIQQAGVTDAVLRDYTGPGDAGHSELAFTAHSGEDFQFTAPSSSLTVRTHGGSTVSLAGFDAAFSTPGLIFEDPSGTSSRFVLAASEVLPDAIDVTVTGKAVWDLNGGTETIDGLWGNGTVDNTAAGTAALVVGSGDASSTFSGVIRDTGGDVSLTKAGGGTLTLSGVNTYAGATTIAGGTLRLAAGGGVGGVFTNVPEAAGYNLVYELPIPNGCSFGSGVPYSVDNTAVIPDGSFSRVGYYLELQQGANPRQWVYTSFDAAPFATQANKLGVPNATSGILYHYDAAGSLPGQVRNMNVYSNVPALVGPDRTGVTTGNVEFWSTNYGRTNIYGVPGASDSTYDFGDQDSPGSHGSMQIHDYGLGKTLLSFGAFNAGSGTLAIGSQSSGEPDWTFNYNVASYSVKTLQVVADAHVSQAIPPASPVVIAAGASLDLNGYSATIGSLADGAGGGGTVVNSDPARPVTLTVNPASGSTAFSGTIGGDGDANAITLTKTGAGTQVLGGHNTYHGDTNVNGGTLQLTQGAGQQPLAVSGWNQDFIWANSEPTAPDGTTYTLNNWVYYEKNATRYGGLNGLPSSRSFVSALDPDVTFQLQPYDALNTLLTTTTPATLTLAEPGQFAALNVLSAKGNATVTITYTLNFADSSTTSGTFQPNDWTAPNAIKTSLAQRSTSGGTYHDNAGLSEHDIVLSAADQAKVLNSITFTAAGGGGSWIMGLSGELLTVPSTDILPDTSPVSIASGATLDLTGNSETIGPLSGSGGTVSLDAGTVTVNSSDGVNPVDTTFAGQITGSGGLVKDGGGTLTLRGVNTYGGSTIIETGTLRLEGGLAAGAKIMPTGDSITNGSGGTNAGYRGPLYSLLTGAGYGFQFVGSATTLPGSLPTTPVDQTHHEGHGGWTVAQILNGVTPVAQGGLGWLSVDPDLITLMIGTNNRGGDVPTAIGQLGQIIDTVHAQAPDALLMVAEIIPINDPAYTSWVNSYNSSLVALVNSKIAAGDNVELVDLNTGFPATGFADTLHPNDTGYNWMAQEWFDAIVAGGGLGGSNVLPTATAVSIASGATLDLNGVTQTIASLSDYGVGGGTVVNGAAATPLTLTIAPAGGSTTFSGTIDDGGAANAVSLVKTGAGTLVLAGDNTYSGPTTINAGTLVAATDTALGGTAGGTAVRDGGTLALPGGVTISGEALTLNGTGAPGQPGALVNLSGVNTIAASSPITAQNVIGGQAGIGSVAGTLTIDAPVDLQYSKLTVTGAGDTVINGDISSGSVNDLTATDVFTNVAEADGYTLAYELIPNGSVTGAAFPYTVNNTAAIGAFDRVAYYLELDGVWVYASMDAFTANVNQIGIPYGSTLFKWQQKVNNLNVFASAGSGITTGTGLATGNIEIWPS